MKLKWHSDPQVWYLDKPHVQDHSSHYVVKSRLDHEKRSISTFNFPHNEENFSHIEKTYLS